MHVILYEGLEDQANMSILFNKNHANLDNRRTTVVVWELQATDMARSTVTLLLCSSTTSIGPIQRPIHATNLGDA